RTFRGCRPPGAGPVRTPFAWSGRLPFDNEMPAGRARVTQPKAGGREEVRELLARPLAPSGDDEHREVAELRLQVLVGAADEALEHEQEPGGGDRAPDGLQDAPRVLVLPVVDDRAQDVRVGARRNGLEEAP